MANEPIKPKKGMGDSNGGRSRSPKTAVVKASGKKARWEEAKEEIRAFLSSSERTL